MRPVVEAAVAWHEQDEVHDDPEAYNAIAAAVDAYRAAREKAGAAPVDQVVALKPGELEKAVALAREWFTPDSEGDFGDAQVDRLARAVVAMDAELTALRARVGEVERDTAERIASDRELPTSPGLLDVVNERIAELERLLDWSAIRHRALVDHVAELECQVEALVKPAPRRRKR